MSAEEQIRRILCTFEQDSGEELIKAQEDENYAPSNKPMDEATKRLTDLMAEARIEELQNLIGLDDEGKEPDYAMRIVDRIRSLRSKEEKTE